jgi:hypothetical protein
MQAAMRRKRKQQARRRQATVAALLALLGAAGAGLVPVLRRRLGGGAGSGGAGTETDTHRDTGPRVTDATPSAQPTAGEATAESPGGAGGTPVPAGVTPAPATADAAVPHEWHCESCGQAFRISGEGRHRIYWLPDAAPSDPVVDGQCPSCGTPLPGERART